jgi:hypothetical protein
MNSERQHEQVQSPESGRTHEVRVGMSVYWVKVIAVPGGWFRWTHDASGAVGLAMTVAHALKDARLVLAERDRVEGLSVEDLRAELAALRKVVADVAKDLGRLHSDEREHGSTARAGRLEELEMSLKGAL